MTVDVSPLFLVVGAPLVGVLLIVFRAPARLVALSATAVMMAAALWVAPAVLADGGMHYKQSLDWLQAGGVRITLGVGVDGISLPLVLLTCVVALAAVLSTRSDMPRTAEFHACLLLIAAGAAGSFIATDLFFLYVFHELALVPAFLGIGIWGEGPRRVFVTFHTVIYLAAGSLVLLAGILGLIWTLRGGPGGVVSTDLAALRDLALAKGPAVAGQRWIAGLLLAGFGILVGLFPFHTWAPKAYSAAPAPVSMLHAGVLKKIGIYGLIRVALPLLPGGMDGWRDVLLVLLMGNILVIGWVALAQRQLNDLLGYSSVMHMGYLFLGLAAGTQLSLTGVVLLSVGHGLSIAGLFAVNGLVLERAGTTSLDRLGGIATRMPLLGFSFTVLALASVGLPGLANFAGEVAIFFGSWGARGDWLWGPWPALSWGTTAAVFGLILSAVYMLGATKAAFFGPAGEAPLDAAIIPLPRKAALLLLMACLLGVGLAPVWLSSAAAGGIGQWLGALIR